MKTYSILLAAMACLSSFAHATPSRLDCISLAQGLPTLKTPSVAVVQLGNHNWSTNRSGVPSLVKALTENPDLCSDLQQVVEFATLPAVKALAARTEKQGGGSAIEVLISRGEHYGSVEDNGTYTSRTVYENANYKVGSSLIMTDLTIYNVGAHSTAPYGCSLAVSQDNCLQHLQAGVEQIERSEQH